MKKQKLKYLMVGGSLLGVIRHKGMIPWDDDIDVAMPRPDYNKFVKLAKQYLPDYMDIKTMSMDPNYNCYYTKLINNIMKITVDHGQYVAKIGIWISIYPIDGLPDKKNKSDIYMYFILI